MSELISADDWLKCIDKAGREFSDVLVGLDLLDGIVAKEHSRPTVGFMERHTVEKTS